MGRILFIRVAAETYSESAVQKAWPLLYRLAFEVEGGIKSGLPVPAPSKGVLELIRNLQEKVEFDLLPKEVVVVLKPLLGKLFEQKVQLEQQLAERNAQRAYDITNMIEDSLDSIEKAVADSGACA